MSDIISGLPIVVPAHNSGLRLWETLRQLVRELDRDDVEAVIVENGPSDDTWEIAGEFAPGSWEFSIRIFRPEVELDAAYLEGASEAKGEVVLLTADDLPFGITDTRSWESVGDPSTLVVDLRAHPGSVVPRSRLQVVVSWGCRSLRRVILGMTVGNCQGILFINRTWLQRHIPLFREHGYLANTEIVHLAQASRRCVVEAPVILQVGYEHGGTRIRIADVWDIAVGFVRLRRRRHMLRVVLKES